MEVGSLITGLCFLSVSFSLVHSEYLKISPNVFSGKENPSWTIAKPVDAAKQADFKLLISYLERLPKPDPSVNSVSGYDGFLLQYFSDVEPMKEIRVARCNYPDLEQALYDTAPINMDPKIFTKSVRDNIQNGINKCPRSSNTV